MPGLNETSEREREYELCSGPLKELIPAAFIATYLWISHLPLPIPPSSPTSTSCFPAANPTFPFGCFLLFFFLYIYLYILYPVSQSVSNYWSLRQMFGESFSCAKFFRRLALPPPVHLKHLLRLIFPFQNVFNCRTFAPTGQSNDVGHNMCEHLFRGHLP